MEVRPRARSLSVDLRPHMREGRLGESPSVQQFIEKQRILDYSQTGPEAVHAMWPVSNLEARCAREDFSFLQAITSRSDGWAMRSEIPPGINGCIACRNSVQLGGHQKNEIPPEQNGCTACRNSGRATLWLCVASPASAPGAHRLHADPPAQASFAPRAHRKNLPPHLHVHHPSRRWISITYTCFREFFIRSVR